MLNREFYRIISRYLPEFNDALSTWFTDFITGQKDIDKDWNAYLTALDRVGLQKIAQEVNDLLLKK